MTPDRARLLAAAIAGLSSPDDARALLSAGAVATLIAAENVSPKAWMKRVWIGKGAPGEAPF